VTLQQLIYVSTASDSYGAAVMRDIEGAALRHNVPANISGLLLFDGMRFLQVLEGPAGAVRKRYARISVDARHFGTHIVSQKTVAGRSFANWAMLCHEIVHGQPLPAAVAPFLEGVAPDMRALFEGFARMRSKTS
jgi:Sensors of blue-light using FAD